MTDLERLAERVEALTEPDDTIDELILLATGWTLERAKGLGRRATWVNPQGDRTSRRQGDNWFKPTASLDAAMTLVPANWKLRQMAFSAPCADDRKWHLNLHGGREGENTFVGRGSSPALSLCAAALRAAALAAKSREVG